MQPLKMIIAGSLLVSLAAHAADPVYTTAAPADSGCKSYDISDIINSIDKNRDAKLTHEEWAAAGAPESSFNMFDPNKRGYTTAAEFAAGTPPADIDSNHDCKITFAEMKAMENKMPPAGPAKAGAPAEKPKS